MVHGTEEIVTNKKSFEDMATIYGRWVKMQEDYGATNSKKK